MQFLLSFEMDACRGRWMIVMCVDMSGQPFRARNVLRSEQSKASETTATVATCCWSTLTALLASTQCGERFSWKSLVAVASALLLQTTSLHQLALHFQPTPSSVRLPIGNQYYSLVEKSFCACLCQCDGWCDASVGRAPLPLPANRCAPGPRTTSVCERIRFEACL